MNCRLCSHHRSRVIHTETNDSHVIRVRQCERCGNRWKTEEIDADTAKRAREVLDEVRELAGRVL